MSMLITSVNNDKIKKLVKLKNKKYRDESGLFFIEGLDLVKEAYDAKVIECIYILDGYDIPYTDIPYVFINEDCMKKISDMDSISEYYAVCHKKEDSDIGNRIIVLDNIQDPGNLGTIIRSSVAFNFSTVVISKNGVDMYNPKVLRSTKGMIFNTNVIVRDIPEFLNELSDYEIIGTDVNDGVNIKNMEINKNVAIVIGNEGNGISSNVRELCNKFIYLDMNNKCESLNAGVAASIIMYEVNNK